VTVDGVDRLPEMLEHNADMLGEMVGVPGDLVRTVRALPSYYLRYYYLTDVVLREQMEGHTRAQEVMDIEHDLLELYKDPTLDTKPELLEHRGGAFYSEAAAQLIASLNDGAGDIQVVDTYNRGALPDLPDNAVVEVPARITNSCCLKNQSAARSSSCELAAAAKSRPAMRMRPLLSRRTSRLAPSISSCAKRGSSASSERGESAAKTRGKVSATRCSASRMRTSRSSIAGTQPLERASMAPIRIGAPSMRLARASMAGRHSSMCGRISQ